MTKDLDINVFKEDLTKLYELLLKQGFRIFLNYDENGKKLMRRVTAEKLKNLKIQIYQFVKSTQKEEYKKKQKSHLILLIYIFTAKMLKKIPLFLIMEQFCQKNFLNQLKKNFQMAKKLISLNQPLLLIIN